jgi:NAD(P)-dependent dehydrogenase (short-subunit alcohol dehydrogenase family)
MKYILVTGSNRGIGLEFVRQYLRIGCTVIATCRKPDESSELQDLLKDHSNRFVLKRLEVTNQREIDQLPSEIAGEVDRIDLMINNAGIFPSNRFDTVTEDQMVDTFRVNCVAPLMLTRSFRGLLKKGHRPLVVNISSMLGSVSSGAGLGHWKDYAYGTSKAALNRVVRQLALELKDDGIIVVAQNPGWVRTDMGGDEAPLSPSEAVADMRELFGKLSIEDSGRFIEPDNRNAPW